MNKRVDKAGSKVIHVSHSRDIGKRTDETGEDEAEEERDTHTDTELRSHHQPSAVAARLRLDEIDGSADERGSEILTEEEVEEEDAPMGEVMAPESTSVIASSSQSAPSRSEVQAMEEFFEVKCSRSRKVYTIVALNLTLPSWHRTPGHTNLLDMCI